MELWEEMARYVLRDGGAMQLPVQIENLNALLENECYKALKRIKEIVQDDTLDDPHCFWKIEEIVCELERIGSDGGGRHDFS